MVGRLRAEGGGSRKYEKNYLKAAVHFEDGDLDQEEVRKTVHTLMVTVVTLGEVHEVTSNLDDSLVDYAAFSAVGVVRDRNLKTKENEGSNM